MAAERGPTPVTRTVSHEEREQRRSDVLTGGALLAIGLLVTVLSFMAAEASGRGGRYVVATGAIGWGFFRLMRGLSRRD